jgi:hypothetical protein
MAICGWWREHGERGERGERRGKERVEMETPEIKVFSYEQLNNTFICISFTVFQLAAL